MAKTEITKQIEEALWKNTSKMGTYGCFEVKIGYPKTQRFLTGREEFVDYMTYSSDGTIRCYEIKVSEADAKSKANLSFLGNYNYLVMTDELYQSSKDKDWFRTKTFNGAVGVMVFRDGCIEVVKKPKKNTVSVGVQALLLESLTKSLSREVDKYYNQLYKGVVKIGLVEYNELKSSKKELEALRSSNLSSYSTQFDLELVRLKKKLVQNGELESLEIAQNPEKILIYLREKAGL